MSITNLKKHLKKLKENYSKIKGSTDKKDIDYIANLSLVIAELEEVIFHFDTYII